MGFTIWPCPRRVTAAVAVVGLIVAGCEDKQSTEVQGATVTAQPEQGAQPVITDAERKAMRDWTFRYGVPDAQATSAAITVVAQAAASEIMGQIVVACRTFESLVKEIKTHPEPILADVAAKYGTVFDHLQDATAKCTRGALNSDASVISQATNSFRLAAEALKEAIAAVQQYTRD